MEEIRQQIKSKRGKFNRYKNRISQYQQNRTFRNNERMFYKKLNGNENNENTNSTPDEIKFITRMLNGFQTPNLNSCTLTVKKI